MTRQHAGPAIETVDLRKRFGDTIAIDGVDLEVQRGTILGLLGPNGAGKTSIVRILATLSRPDGGTASVGGYDVVRDAHRVRSLVGLTGQHASVDEDLTGRQNLVMLGRLLGLPRSQAKRRADDLLDAAGLDAAATKPAKTYSGGMRRRLDLAASLVHRPHVVFLDEPTTGLDPARRGDTWRLVRELAAQGSTVLLTTQYLEEADHLADEIVVVDAGAVAARGTPEALKRRLGRQTLDLRIDDDARVEDAAHHVAAILQTQPNVDAHTRRITAPIADASDMPAIVRALDADDIAVSELALRLPSLDDAFLALTGHPAAPPQSPTIDAVEETTT